MYTSRRFRNRVDFGGNSGSYRPEVTYQVVPDLPLSDIAPLLLFLRFSISDTFSRFCRALVILLIWSSGNKQTDSCRLTPGVRDYFTHSSFFHIRHTPHHSYSMLIQYGLHYEALRRRRLSQERLFQRHRRSSSMSQNQMGQVQNPDARLGGYSDQPTRGDIGNHPGARICAGQIRKWSQWNPPNGRGDILGFELCGELYEWMDTQVASERMDECCGLSSREPGFDQTGIEAVWRSQENWGCEIYLDSEVWKWGCRSILQYCDGQAGGEAEGDEEGKETAGDTGTLHRIVIDRYEWW